MGSLDPTLNFGPPDICTVNHRPPVGLCLVANEDRGTREHFANLDQMAIWSRKCDIKRIHHLHRDVTVSRPTWSREHFFGLGHGFGLTVIGLGLGLGLMMYWSRVSYLLVSWSLSDHLLS